MEKQSKDRKSNRNINQGMTGNTGGQKNVSGNTFNNKREHNGHSQSYVGNDNTQRGELFYNRQNNVRNMLCST